MATKRKTEDHTKGASASTAGRAIQESSDEVRQAELGVTGTRETTLAGLAGAAPVVDHSVAARDEAKRQADDDARRQAHKDAEAKLAEAQAALDALGRGE